MASHRQRLTWNKSAGAAPALPGYGKEDHDHPAYHADPGVDDYRIGGPSEFAEDVSTRPILDGNPPALPGYDKEDQDHPAHSKTPRMPKLAIHRLNKKAALCLRLAQAVLADKGVSGRTAKTASAKRNLKAKLEDMAVSYMDYPEAKIQAALDVRGGGFLAGFDDFGDAEAEPFNDLDPDFDGDMDLGGEFDDDFGGGLDDGFGDDSLVEDDALFATQLPGDELGMMRAQLRQMQAALQTLVKKAGEEDESDEEEEDAPPVEKKASKKMAAWKRWAAENGIEVDEEEDDGESDKKAADDKDEDDKDGGKESFFEKMEKAKADKKASDDEDEDDEDEAPVATDKAASSKRLAAVRSLTAAFNAIDTDRDGVVLASEWQGSRALFAAIDTDGDGAITTCDYVSAMSAKSASTPKLAAEEEQMLRELQASFDAKVAGEDEPEDEPEEEEAPEADKKAAVEEEVEEEEETDKAASFDDDFSFGDSAEVDLMGPMSLQASDVEAMEALFGPQGKTANDLNLKPRAKAASTGVKSLGQLAAPTVGDEASKLEKLWKNAPNVDALFNLRPRG